MKKAAVLLLLLSLASFVSAEIGKHYELTISYDNGKLTNEQIKVGDGNAAERLRQPETGYTLKVISFKGAELYSMKFVIETEPAMSPPIESITKERTFDEALIVDKESLPKPTEPATPQPIAEVPGQTSLVLVVPYFKNAKSIEIYDLNENLALSVDVSEFALCNENGACDAGETAMDCPGECHIDEKTAAAKRANWWLWIAVPIVLIAVIVMIVLFVRKKK